MNSEKEGDLVRFRILQLRGRNPAHFQGPEPLSLMSEIRIRWCPTCGRNLLKWYKRTWPELVRPEIPVIELSDGPPEEP